MALRVRAGRQKCMHPLLTHRVLRSHESVDEAHRPVAMLRVLEDFDVRMIGADVTGSDGVTNLPSPFRAGGR